MEYKRALIKKKVWSLTQKFIVSSLLIISWTVHVLAYEDTLDSARIEKVKNNVVYQNSPQDKTPHPVKKLQNLSSGNLLETKKNSAATLLFDNQKYPIINKPLINVGETCLFTFKSGRKKDELQDFGRRISIENNHEKYGKCATLTTHTEPSVSTIIETPVSKTILSSSLSKTALHSNSNILLPEQNNPVQVVTNYSSITKNNKISQSINPSIQPPLRTPLTQKANAAVIVEHSSSTNTTIVYALTDGIKVFDIKGDSVTLLGGQKVKLTSQGRSKVEEESLQSFYAKSELAKGFGPGQESIIAEEPLEVQRSIKAVLGETLKAVDAQKSRISKIEENENITRTFLNPSSDLRSSKERLPLIDLNPGRQNSRTFFSGQSVEGTFTRTSDNEVIFNSDDGRIGEVKIAIDRNGDTITLREITVDNIRFSFGQGGKVGLSGNDVKGTAFNENGESIQITVSGVNGKEPPINSRYRGSLRTGIPADGSVPGSFRLIPPRDK
jgi:hypothetical protein